MHLRWVLIREGLAALSLIGFVSTAVATSFQSFSPQGEVAQVRQIALRFSEPVVPLGEPRLPDPVSVNCSGNVPQGKGRWLDQRGWVFDFPDTLPPGSRCTVKLRPDWKPLPSASPLSGRSEFSFNTGGPAVVNVSPFEGAMVEEDQHFLLQLNGPAVESTVLANAWCEVEGIGERQPVQLVGGAARAALLKARKTPPAVAARSLLLRCPRPLPADAALRLVWGRGIAASAEPKLLTSVEQNFSFRVRAAFTAEFSCERERSTADCLPIRPISLRFSAPVSRALAAEVRLVSAAGKLVSPVFEKNDRAEEVSGLEFPFPLPENQQFRIEMPQAMLDISGRKLANAASFPLQVATADVPPIAKFAAAPFGIVESADPVVPLTLRHVQGEIRGNPAGSGNGVRVKRIAGDADILAWYNKLQRYQQRTISAEQAGLPKAQWTVVERERDANGRSIERRAERQVDTRALSLLTGSPDSKRLALPHLREGDPRPFEVVGIPLGEPGYHVIEIESARLGRALLDKPAPLFVRSGILVTNLGVHFKLGRENSLIWVTSLDRGQVVPDAELAVYNCLGKQLWNGRSDASGLAAIKLALDPDMGECPGESGFFVTARKTVEQGPFKGRSDMSFVFSSWQQGIEGWRFGLPTAGGVQPEMRAHTVFDRSLLRAGETVSMKHFLRRETLQGLSDVAAADLPTRLKIIHQGSGEEVLLPLVWDGSRSALSSWQIPVAAKLGSYEVLLEREGAADGQGRISWASGDFRVEEFRVPLVDARLSGPKLVPVAPAQLSMALQLNYLSGGPMAAVPLRASALLKRRHVRFDNREGFSFDPPSEPETSSSDNDEEGANEATTPDGKLIADKLQLSTDAQGAANILLKDLPALDRPSELLVEASFNDPNGETSTVATRLALWPSAVVPGIKASSWASNRGRSVNFTAIALDTKGRPIKGQLLQVRGRHIQVISSRKRLVGGFYAYENHNEIKDLGILCSGNSDQRGLLLCEAELDASGRVELIAETKDVNGQPARAATSVWISGRGEMWFAQDNDDRIDVLPEKFQYEAGEIARLQVRMPYREATALISIEREGVIESRVATLSGSDPTIEVAIQPGWGPNVYISVLALRGRIREVPWYSLFTWGWRQPLSWIRAFWYEGRQYQAPSAMVDLAKPSFKFGVAALKIGVAAHQLQVSVSADKPLYRVRDKVLARVKVSQGGKPVAGAEVAFAAVDEGLLALRDNASWGLLEAMLRQRAWGVETSTAQSEIIGRRHYGRKAVPAGGGGGRGGVRELFDTLLTWQPRVQLDANGEALIEVSLNDSLTSFKLIAVADAADQKFGSGSTSIRVSQDLQLLAGLPALVRDGDRFSAMLTLRNTTAKDMKVNASLKGIARTGGADPETIAINLPDQEVTLAAGAAAALSWQVEVPAGAVSLTWQADAVEQGLGRAVDRVKLSQQVVAAVPLRVTQASLLRMDKAVMLPVAAPAQALPASGVKSGGIVAAIQPRLGADLPGIRRFFETYPYSCLEQEFSKSVGLGDRQAWADLMNRLPSYLDSDGLASFFPPQAGSAADGSDRLTAYLIAAADESGFELPAPLRQRLLQGLQSFVTGRIERRFWAPPFARGRDLDVRKMAAIEALSRHGLAQPAMLGVINLAPNTWPTAAVIDWLRVLQRVDGIADRAQRRSEAQQILRSRLTFSGTTLRFSTEASDAWWWLMDSADANAARLILAVLDDTNWKDELPRLVVGSLGRQNGGAWSTTTANLWGVLALEKFAKRFEAVAVAGRTEFSINDQSGGPTGAPRTFDWAQQPAGGEVSLPWPASAGQLRVDHHGTGAPWLSVQALAAIPLTAPFEAGYAVSRSVSAIERKVDGIWSRGDVLRVRLEVDARSDKSWVVVSDPIPAGATVLGSGLGRDSAIASREERREGSAALAFVERSLQAFRAYYSFLPRGKHLIEYSIRLNNPGLFRLPPTRVEAMYAPETYAESPNATLEVGP